MSTTDNDMLHAAIRKTLSNRAGGARDAGAVAKATLDTWHMMTTQLAPVIGARGVDVLLSRALHLASASLPWLAIAGDHGDSAAVRAKLKVRLASLDSAAAAEASTALLVTFTDLLTTLIGTSLTERLLGPVWATLPASTASEPETVS